MYSGFTEIDIKSIDIIDRDGNTFTSISFDEALNYNDSYLNKVAEMTEYYNAGVDKEDFTEYNDMYDSWEEEYLLIDGANTYLRSKDIYNGVVWFKIIGSLVLYTLFVLIVGDIVVGKRRIIALFQRIGNRGNNGGYVSRWPQYFAYGASQTSGGNDNAEPGNGGSFGQGGDRGLRVPCGDGLRQICALLPQCLRWVGLFPH